MARAHGRKRLVELSGRLLGGHTKQRANLVVPRGSAFANALVVLANDLDGALHLFGVALDFQVAAICQMSANLQGGFEQLQVFVESAEKFVDLSGDTNSLFQKRAPELRLARVRWTVKKAATQFT
ncbi:MAG TPA: hypothetical protein VJR26_09590 [Candidatus Acidoferrales bacterium]|nr:hypothetical protein [Candidatus Acidoferrales bacterium]